MAQIKCFVLDTSVLLYNPNSLTSFGSKDVFLPIQVLEELDNMKTGLSEKGRNARITIRKINELRAKGNLIDGVTVNEKGGVLRVIARNNKGFLFENERKVDNLIIEACIDLGPYSSSEMKDYDPILITKDICLALKADALGIKSQDFHEDTRIKEVEDLYSGTVAIGVDPATVDSVYANEYIQHDFTGIYLNPKHTAMVKVSNDMSWLRLVKNTSVWGAVTPRNARQHFATDLLLDDSIKLATISGLAGSGKTLIALAAGLQKVLEERKYESLVITRPTVGIDENEDLGFLPGPQPLDAKILTPTGWEEMGNIKIGDKVIAKEGVSSEVVGVYPKGSKSVYKITTTDGVSTECCLDHLWYTKTFEDKKGGRQGCVKSIKEIIKTLKTKTGKLNHYLPRNKPVEFKKSKLPIPPYTLGALLGDGSIGEYVCISNVDEEIINRVGKEIKNLGCTLSTHKNTINYYIRSNLYNNKPAKRVKIYNIITENTLIFNSSGEAAKTLGVTRNLINYRCAMENIVEEHVYSFLPCKVRWQNPIKEALYNLGLSNTKAHTKFIPREYLYRTSIEDRVALLQGLMDTDGTIKDNGEASFSTTSKALALNVIELVKSLSGRAVLRQRDRRGVVKGNIDGRKITTKMISYEFNVSLPRNINPFYLPRKAKKHRCSYIHDQKIQSIEYVGEKEVQCIKIDNPEHLYITDNYIVTHNTMEEKFEPWLRPIRDQLEFLMGNKKTARAEFEAMIDAGTIKIEPLAYIRGRTFNDSYIILDECQNVSRHTIKTFLTRVGENSKVVLTGDILQIDSPKIDAVNNGLTQTIERFKDIDIAGHITLNSCERSTLAQIAATLL
jgi:predicted ribonuclease YlaK